MEPRPQQETRYQAESQTDASWEVAAVRWALSLGETRLRRKRMRVVITKKTKIKTQTPRENDLNHLRGDSWVSSVSFRETKYFKFLNQNIKEGEL